MRVFDHDGYDGNGVNAHGYDRHGVLVIDNDPLKLLTVADWDWINHHLRLAQTVRPAPRPEVLWL